MSGNVGSTSAETRIQWFGSELFDPASRSDPYPHYHWLRDNFPIYHSPAGIWILSRHDDVTEVLRDPQFGYDGPRAPRARALLAQKDHAGLLHDANGKSVNSFLTKNPPEHTRLRKLVSPSLTPRSVERLVPRITETTAALLDAVLDSGEVDFVESFAYRLPFSVLCELLAIPDADRPKVLGWSATLARGLDPEFLLSEEDIGLRVQAMLESATYFYELSAERARRPGTDLLSTLATAKDSGDMLTSAELLATCILLLVAGHESTASLIAGGLLALLQHPVQLARLYSEPGLAANAVEEFLRYDPPPQLVFRTALADVMLRDTTIPAGTMVMALLGAANRDPTVFPEPDKLDITRTGQRHFGFSHGIHFCVGAPLARLEATIALECLLARTSALRLSGEPEWKPNVALRGLETLPITLTGRGV